jgi:DNA-directed RNA polymerase specialized sigma24 family protein
MRRNYQPWLEHEDKTLKKLKENGATYEEAAEILQRSVESVRQRKYRKGYLKANKTTKRKKVELEHKEPTKALRHTKQTNPKVEVTLFWGLVKYSKA